MSLALEEKERKILDQKLTIKREIELDIKRTLFLIKEFSNIVNN